MTEWGVRYRYADGAEFDSWTFTERGAKAFLRTVNAHPKGWDPRPVAVLHRSVGLAAVAWTPADEAELSAAMARHPAGSAIHSRSPDSTGDRPR